jgi:hypothetical protein
MELVCSMKECREPILGVGVVLADTMGAGIDWASGNFLVYGDTMDGTTYTKPWIVLHPNCFHLLFDEFMRQELMTAITMFVGPTGDLMQALEA